MRTWITSDSHFNRRDTNVGMLKYSPMLFKIMSDYYDNFFIPNVLKNKKDGDILIHCGDLFDYGDYIEVKVMNYIINLFERFVDIFGEVYLICGNHDIYNKNDNSINAINFLKDIPGVTLIINEPYIINDIDKKVVLVPWQSTSKKEKTVLENIGSSDFYFAHTTLQGAHYSNGRYSEHGQEPETFSKFGKVYTGHIHTTQKIKNVTFVGSPYELTRNDAGNPKYIYCVDFQTGEEIQIKNDYSPQYKKINYSYIKEGSDETLASLISSNFVDIIFDNNGEDNKDYDEVMERLHSFNPLKTENVKAAKKVEATIDAIVDVDVQKEISGGGIEDQVTMYLNEFKDYKDVLNHRIVEYISKMAKKV